MSENNKLLVRPKVRFSSVYDSKEKHQQTENVSFVTTAKSNGPKIKSIVTFKQPIRIVSQDKSSNINKNTKDQDHVTKKDSGAGLCNNFTNFCLSNDSNKLQESPLCNNFHVKPDVQWPLNDMSNTDNIQTNQETLGTQWCIVSSNKKSDGNNISCPVLESGKSIQKIKNEVEKTDSPILKQSLKRAGKENYRNPKDKVVATRKIQKESMQAEKYKPIVQKNKLLSTEKITTNKTNGYKPKVPNTKCMVRGVMPCLKYSKSGIKSKISPAKKTVMRDIIGNKIKPYVGPGIPRKNNTQQKKSMENVDNTSNIAATERLSKPDYNSIRCTLNKLNEVKNEKIVTDIEHLPTAYKNLMNRKISAALDFLPDEIIYKNLVNLSVDEKQLPSRLTRTKDPEPRQKDIVPKLSDFFKPEHAEEYSTAVSVKPRHPEIQERWNAFRISDKIFEWKHNIDHGQ